MAGNSQRKGAIRATTKKVRTSGSGGTRQRGLEGKGPTPAAELRPGHVKQRKAALVAKKTEHGARTGDGRGGPRGAVRGRKDDAGPEIVVGRNSVLEALLGMVPVTVMHVGEGIEPDERVREAVNVAANRGIAMLDSPRPVLDRLAGVLPHQGLLLVVPPYEYAAPEEILQLATSAGQPPLLIATDHLTDPRNLGAIVRSAAAFGAHGVLVPDRRSAGVTAASWKASAGAIARVPVAKCTNLVRTLQAWQREGIVVVGLDGTAADALDSATAVDLTDGIALVIGNEGTGLSRLVRETCDVLVQIPMTSSTESLNASVAAGIAMYQIARARARG